MLGFNTQLRSAGARPPFFSTRLAHRNGVYEPGLEAQELGRGPSRGKQDQAPNQAREAAAIIPLLILLILRPTRPIHVHDVAHLLATVLTNKYSKTHAFISLAPSSAVVLSTGQYEDLQPPWPQSGAYEISRHEGEVDPMLFLEPAPMRSPCAILEYDDPNCDGR